jgi:dienelactone hydrolase
VSRGLGDVLAAAPRAAMLPAAILGSAARLATALPDPALAADPAAALAALRPRIAWCLGLDRLPRTEPVWTPVRAIDGGSYTVEVGTFEAVPGLVVAAHVYRPSAPGPHPAAVHAPGHWMENGRLEPDVQRYCAQLARAGLVVLCYDPIGQGERRRGWHTHGQLAPLLAGFTSLAVMVAETIGGLDVLAARADVDATRLAVTGASGGGLVSLFTAAVDPRPRAAAICCIVNTHVSQVRDAAYGTGWDGWADLCNQVPRLAATANVGHVLAAALPADLTVVHAVDDPPFPIVGARAVVAEAARSYAACGVPHALRLIEVEGGHGLHAATRAAAIAGLTAALGLPAAATDAPEPLLAHAWDVTHEVARAARPQSTCRVEARLPGEALDADVDTNPVVAALARSVAVSHRRGRAPDRAAVVASLGGLPAPSPRVAVTNHVTLAEGGYAQRLEIVVEPGITIDAVLLLPEVWADAAPGVLITVDEGGKGVALAGPAAVAARRRGLAVLAVDLRGTGESSASEFELATASWLLDRDLLAARVDDLRAAVRVVSERYSTGMQVDKRRILVHGDGPFALVALLAGALDDDVAGTLASGFVESLEELLTESPRFTPMVFPFRALETYDVADLVRISSPRPVLVDDAATGVGRLLEAVGR